MDSLDEAVKYVSVATQMIGFYPFERMSDHRDRFAGGGARRVVRPGEDGTAAGEGKGTRG